MWSQVKTRSGEQGYVPTSAISNVWIRVSKRRKAVYVYRGTELVRKVPADFGANVASDKVRRGNPNAPDDWRTPEGSFFVVSKNPSSKFYKALVLNYPSAEDAERGFREGLITQAERDAIQGAEQRGDMPPMDTMLGGWIEIHGSGTGGGTNWTQGCVAIRNEQMDDIWPLVHVGTPVITEF
jgi:murein L,D-transpeptidase YafK